MSESEAHLPGLDLNADDSVKKPAKKAARKTATKKAASKRVAKKAASTADAATSAAKADREAPVKETPTRAAAARKTEAAEHTAKRTAGTADTAGEREAPRTREAADSAPDASAARGENTRDTATPRRAAFRRTEREEGTAARESNRRTEREESDTFRENSRHTERNNGSDAHSRRPARNEDGDAVPTSFSASPDDVDDYGDVRERNRRERFEREQEKARENESAPATNDDGRDASHENRQKDGAQGNAQRYGNNPRHDNRPPFKKPFRQNGNNGEDSGEDARQEGEGRDNYRPQQGNGKGGNGQPYGKKPFFQKGNGGQNPQGNGQPQQQGGNPGKFQKFKKGDKFNPNQQQGGKKAKLPHPGKVKPGKKGSWQSQFAAASEEDTQPPVFDSLIDWELFRSPELLAAKIAEITTLGAAPATSAEDATADSGSAQGNTAPATAADPAGTSAPDSAESTTPAEDDHRSDTTAATLATGSADATASDAADAGSAATASGSVDGEVTAKDSEAAQASGEDAAATDSAADATTGEAAGDERPATPDAIAAAKIFEYDRAYALKLPELEALARKSGITWEGAPNRRRLLAKLLAKAAEQKRPIRVRGLVELLEEGFGFVVFGEDNYRLRSDSPFLAAPLVNRYGLQRGHEIEALLHPAQEGETTPFVLRVDTVMGKTPEEAQHLTPFKELVPYYPTERILLESEQGALGKWDNISMRIVDLLSPVGLGQRGLIVAPPRTGKTVLMQGIANAIRANRPQARLIILLVDERPEEVTDFRRSVKGAQVVASTFDEAAESHVHAAEMVIEKARRLVETGEDVIILLDSITRLARAYNTTMPSSGKILSGGVEASALQKPKRFFGSARNIEGGGSLTILGTALVETGSKMDEVIFEEFKGTGNMELHLDRELSNKRVFPALSFEKSGTRKEELLYHPDEMEKVHALRRAMKGVPSTDAMEMLIQRVKRSKTNAQFLMSMAR